MTQISAEGCRDGQKGEEERIEDIRRLPVEGHQRPRPRQHEDENQNSMLWLLSVSLISREMLRLSA